MLSTSPPSSSIICDEELDTALVKVAADASTAYCLSGKLYATKKDWILLSVPNALGRGAFDAISELGVELPISGTTGQYNAHISVIRPEELVAAGLTPADINERGHTFHYTLGPVKTCQPAGWSEMSRVWFIEVKSPDLEKLRKSYGLTPKQNGDYEFHITFGVRRKSVLRNNEISKAPSYTIETPVAKAASLAGLVGQFSKVAEPSPYGCCPTCGGKCVSRERCIGGNDRCENGHEYPSANAVHASEKTAATGSIYLDQLAAEPVQFSPSKSLLGNVSGHLQRVRARGDQRIHQRLRQMEMEDALSEDKGLGRLQQTLAGEAEPIVEHPVDRLLSGL